MKFMTFVTAGVLAVTVAGCSSDKPATNEAPTPAVEAKKTPDKATEAKKAPAGEVKKAPPTAPSTAPAAGPSTATSGKVMPDAVAVEKRVTDAHKRLGASEAGKLVLKALKHHGGLKTWYSNGPVAFRFNYKPLAEKPPRNSYQVVDTWASRARHGWGEAKTAEFGWNGTKAWIKDPKGEVKTNPRFWALTPYYFVAVPFVLADPGVVLKEEGEAQLEGRAYDLVKVTFAPGTGDAPDDYYIVYIDRETGRVGGLRYIVTYKGFFKDGAHSPEKLMTYDDAQVVQGITLPKSYSTYAWDPKTKKRGDKVTDTTLTELSFKPDIEGSYFEPIEGAKIVEGL